jgi:hypothetical protein
MKGTKGARSTKGATTEMSIRNDPRTRPGAPPEARPVGRPASPAVTPGNRATPSPRRRPDPRPMRLALAAGGAAALSALLALIGSAALPTTAAVPAAAPTPAGGGANDVAQVRHIVRYVTLAPGQLPPTGATSTPTTVVAAPVATPAPRQRPAVVTSQSGTP